MTLQNLFDQFPCMELIPYHTVLSPTLMLSLHLSSNTLYSSVLPTQFPSSLCSGSDIPHQITPPCGCPSHTPYTLVLHDKSCFHADAPPQLTQSSDSPQAEQTLHLEVFLPLLGLWFPMLGCPSTQTCSSPCLGSDFPSQAVPQFGFPSHPVQAWILHVGHPPHVDALFILLGSDALS